MRIPNNRKGFVIKKAEPETFERFDKFLPASQCLVYGVTKLSHSGVTCFKKFEGYTRRSNANSLSNLLGVVSKDPILQEKLNNEKTTRNLNKMQSRKLKTQATKLSYYSKVRNFTSRKTGSYKFKIGFLTLTAPSGTSTAQFNSAFKTFLHFLSRTANCEYVWKKELGEENKGYHIHLLVNNFIPYYIVSWKWKRALVYEGVKWSQNDDSKDTNAHTRIELPRSRKLISHYIAKYMAKAYDLPKECGYVWGHSEGLEKLKEILHIENDAPKDEVLLLQATFRTISDQFINHTCCELRALKTQVPELYRLFMEQFTAFQEIITKPQVYLYC